MQTLKFRTQIYLYEGQPIPRPKQTFYDYILAAQGLVKRLELWYASADALIAPIHHELVGLYLHEYPLQPLVFKLPRIPGRLLRDVLNDARSDTGLEFMYHFRYKPSHGWFVTKPRQDQSSVRVGYSYTIPDQLEIVMDLHSHNTMPAFFSAMTDNNDEKGARFYAVIGRLDRPNPEIVLRLGMYGFWLHNVPASLLFDDLGPLVDSWLSDGDDVTYYYQPNGHNRHGSVVVAGEAGGHAAMRWFRSVLQNWGHQRKEG